MIVSDHSNIGIPQLYIRTDNGFECVDILENTEEIETNHEFQETSVVYSFCVNKLQVKFINLHILYKAFVSLVAVNLDLYTIFCS